MRCWATEDGGECPVRWEYVCRWCQMRLCRQHAATHGCTEGWLAQRLEQPEQTVVVIEEDG